MRAYCVHCGRAPHVWWINDPTGSHAVIGQHFVPDPDWRIPCTGSGTRLIPDRTPPLHIRALHTDACLTPTGLTCVCPLQASKETH